ncbi:MAG TPA: AAA family ATPase [Steroidobacteraceae bacterium]|nr:AAA family ATPase [Steroidobacteraceae bacterium]
MYLPFYGLAEKPFSITPDPRYLYLGGRHAEALAHLVYGITEAGGFIQLTGEVGTGKTTMIRSLLARRPENAEIALVLNPRMSESEFLQTLCEELGIAVPEAARGSMKELTGLLNRHLLQVHAAGRRVVLIVDEAQNLTPDLLERVRLLSNLETETQKLLQIILIGQPELRDMLARNDLRQLAQRITGRYHLDPLSREETAAYVKHRLRIAGATRGIFTRGALAELHRVSGGVPRLINIIGDRALLGGFTEDRHLQNAAMVRKAAAEVFGRPVRPVWLPLAAGLVGVAMLGAGTWAVWKQQQSGSPAVAAQIAAAPAEEAAVAPAAPEAPPVAPPAAPPTVAQLLQQEAGTAGEDSAWSQLFGLWGAQFTPGAAPPCTQALRQSLECLEERGGLDALRRYNRPALLSLNDDDGVAHQAVLAQLLDEERARLMLGDGAWEVNLADLQARWNGNFQLLWKPSHLDTRNLSLGTWGEPVLNLRARLNAWAGVTVETVADPEYFDEALQDLVMRFQSSNDLVVDGIAGVRTQALLDAAVADAGTPLLSAAR